MAERYEAEEVFSREDQVCLLLGDSRWEVDELVCTRKEFWRKLW